MLGHLSLGFVFPSKMAMFRALMSLVFIAMLVEFAIGANYTVGGTTGWDTSSNLQTWSAAQSFHVGDNLIFQYSPPHNLIEVTKADYDSCQANSPIQTYSDGNTVITLTSPGKRYFTCGVPGHCTQGMKLLVNTLAASAATPTLPTPATSPSPLPSIISPPLPSPFPSIVSPPSPAVAAAPLAPVIPPSLAPTGSVPNVSAPTLPSSESPAAAPSVTAFTTPPPPSTSSSANRGHLLSKLFIFGICFGMMMLQTF